MTRHTFLALCAGSTRRQLKFQLRRGAHVVNIVENMSKIEVTWSFGSFFDGRVLFLDHRAVHAHLHLPARRKHTRCLTATRTSFRRRSRTTFQTFRASYRRVEAWRASNAFDTVWRRCTRRTRHTRTSFCRISFATFLNRSCVAHTFAFACSQLQRFHNNAAVHVVTLRRHGLLMIAQLHHTLARRRGAVTRVEQHFVRASGVDGFHELFVEIDVERDVGGAVGRACAVAAVLTHEVDFERHARVQTHAIPWNNQTIINDSISIITAIKSVVAVLSPTRALRASRTHHLTHGVGVARRKHALGVHAHESGRHSCARARLVTIHTIRTRCDAIDSFVTDRFECRVVDAALWRELCRVFDTFAAYTRRRAHHIVGAELTLGALVVALR
mmetsp:Transcript_17447/g.30481  ORF Transcript_17447/g.30481 Transcript_17447/m.30481 type:complete len:386 (-) Transcript_17447:3219-4376(-)